MKSAEAYKQALDVALIGGNHIANCLINRLGPDFSSKYPPTMDPEIALQHLGPYEDYDMWCCWAAMMKASRMVSGDQTG